jgi:hypothetical protein
MDKAQCYKIMGIAPNSTLEELTIAYRRGAMRLHPDRQGGDDEKFKTFKSAYDFLCKFGNHVVLQNRSAYSVNDFPKSAFNTYASTIDDIKDILKHAIIDLGNVPWKHAFEGINGIKKGIPPGAVFFSENNVMYRVNGISLKMGGFRFKHKFSGNTEMFLGDIVAEIYVPPATLNSGGWVQAVCPFEDTDIMVRIPAGSSQGKILKVKGKGYWNWKRQAISRGDLYLTIS